MTNENPALGSPERELSGLTARAEREILVWLAERMPAGITPDHLTVLGLLGMAGAGAGYALSARDPLWLHAVNAFLVVNWFGDSLDGTLARVRMRQRPHFGFYVDHMVDTLGALFVVLGLAASGLIAPWIAVALLIAYYILTINIYVAASSLGVYKISYGAFGGTELRIFLMLINLVVLAWPEVAVLGTRVRLFDMLGGASAAIIAFIALRSMAQVTRILYDRERI